MNYRGVVKSGVVVLEPDAHLAEGQAVEVIEIPAASAATAELPGFGLWRDREDIKDSGEESLRLRRNMEQRAE
jgi:hypothetical protein